MPYKTIPKQIQAVKRDSQTSSLRKSAATKPDRPSADDECWCDQPLMTSIEVQDSLWTPTGILDVDGNEYHRAPNPIGFIWYED